MIKKILTGIAVVVLFVVGVFSFNKNPGTPAVGSVSNGSSYQSVTIATGLQGTSETLCSTSGVLGSIIITGAAASVLEVYDATTSNSSLRTTVATTSLRKIVSMPASAAANTYTFDANAYQGIIYEVTGTKATTTLTYKCS